MVASAVAGETNIVRLAVGPFFSPSGNERLQKAAQLLPDLLTARLSDQNQFQLVERQKTSEVWRELNITRNEMCASDTMIKLGAVLACDQFVTGDFVETATNTQVWITLLDTHTGIVADLKLIPVNTTNYEATLEAVATFLKEAQTRKPQKFIALGRFVDMSISSTHDEWSGRLRALIEEHFLKAGFGVVDHETVSPIFEELQLEQAGLVESRAKRVKFQPSFWLIDGQCKWVRDVDDKLSVAIRIRKMGEGEKILQFRALPTAALEASILNSVETNLTAGLAIPDYAATEESKLFNQELNQAAKGKIMLSPARFSTNNNNLDDRQFFMQRMPELKQQGEIIAQRAYLMDTNNLKAKFVVASDYFSETNEPAKQERGEQMLQELTTCTNSAIAYQAYYLLSHGIKELGRNGEVLIVKPVRTIDPNRESSFARQMRQNALKSCESKYSADTNNLRLKYFLAIAYFTDLNNATNQARGTRMLAEIRTNQDSSYSIEASNIFANGIHVNDDKGEPICVKATQVPEVLNKTGVHSESDPKPESIISIRPAFTVVDSFKEWPFYIIPDGGWLLSKGPKLSFYNLHGEKTEVSCPNTRNITALAADSDYWWVGTEGEGLIRLSKAGQPPKIWSEKDGLLMPNISALCRQGDRLWIGFKFHSSGGLGYLDLKTGKFIGLQGDADFGQGQTATSASLDVPIISIQAANEKSVWVSTPGKFQLLDSESRRVTRSIPINSDVASMNTSCLTVSSRSGNSEDDIGGVKVFDLAGNHLGKIRFSADSIENDVTALCLAGPQVWAATTPVNLYGDTFIKLVDIPLLKTIGNYVFKEIGCVFWIGTNADNIWFLAGLGGSQIKLCCFNKLAGVNVHPPANVISNLSPDIDPAAPIKSDDQRLQFLQQNFARFVPIQFEKESDGNAVIHVLHVSKNRFGSAGDYYCGFKFTLPPWFDGDFECIYLLAKSEAQRNFRAQNLIWGMFLENGEPRLFEDFLSSEIERYPQLKRRFPYTFHVTHQSMDKEQLEAGKTYGLWFNFAEDDMPDIAVAMTIGSKRGVEECGALPLKSAPSSVIWPSLPENPAASPSELLSRFTAALNVKDTNTALSLIDWQDGSTEEFNDGPRMAGLLLRPEMKSNVNAMLGLGNISGRLLELPSGIRLTNQLYGISYSPNIPVTGMIFLTSTGRNWSQLLFYGKRGNAFYIALKVEEKIPTP